MIIIIDNSHLLNLNLYMTNATRHSIILFDTINIFTYKFTKKQNWSSPVVNWSSTGEDQFYFLLNLT